MPTISLLLDGYTDLPPGYIADVVTYLELGERAAGALIPLPAGFAVRRQQPVELAAYRSLYRRIGERWLWFERARMDDRTLRETLTRAGASVLFLEQDGAPVGLAELQAAEGGTDVEVAMFGVVEEMTGRGAAGALMSHVLDAAFAAGARRVWLHTCHFDHPAALPFYRKMGFRPWKMAIELARDPRLEGHLPREAGPHVPLIDPESR